MPSPVHSFFGIHIRGDGATLSADHCECEAQAVPVGATLSPPNQPTRPRNNAAGNLASDQGAVDHHEAGVGGKS